MSLRLPRPFATFAEATAVSAGNNVVPATSAGHNEAAPPSAPLAHVHHHQYFQQPLTVAVRARKSEYTRRKRIRVKIGSWNVGALEGTENDLITWFRAPDDSDKVLSSIENEQGTDKDDKKDEKETIDRSKIDLYVLGLQEVVDVTSPTEALLRPSSDPATAHKWKGAASTTLPKGYVCVGEQQLVGMLLLIYASPELAPEISSISTSAVGTGLGNNLTGYLGNKGGVAVRLLLGESTRMVFVNCHLAAGNDKQSLDRRNWDAGMVSSKTRFDAALDAGDNVTGVKEKIGGEDFAWWFGDLNYRLEDIPDSDVRRLLEIHMPKEFTKSKDPKEDIDSPYSESNPDLRSIKGERIVAESSVVPEHDEAEEGDRESLQMTLSSLLTHDSLRKQQASRKAFHDGWKEGPITFLPTYKYDTGTVGTFDSSEKRRSPSWCDRILYRSKKHLADYEESLQNEAKAKAKDAEMKARGTDKAGDEEDVLFSYDPETDGLDYGDDDYDYDEDAPEITNEAAKVIVTEEDLQLETYASHQLVTSSDHKPLSAVFNVTYDSVDKDLKAQVQQEVARELDRAENEARPVVTVVVDKESKEGGIDFGEVRYGQKLSGGATIANTGQVPATVNFISRPTATGFGNEYSHNWLKASFERLNDESPGALDQNEVTLQPGDAINISIDLLVEDLTWVRTFNENPDLLEDVLVLGVKDGRDWFIPVRGKWMASMFCRSIDELVKCPEGGVRKLQQAQAKGSISDFIKSDPKRSIPKELYRLTDAISAEIEKEVADWGMRTPTTQKDSFDLQRVQLQDLEQRPPWETSVEWPFTQPSWMFGDSPSFSLMCLTIREAIETDSDFNLSEEASRLEQLEAMGSTLVTFISSLSDGVLMKEIWETLELGLLARERSKTPVDPDADKDWILDTISTASPTHNICFVFLINMLSTVASELAPVSSSISDAEAARRGIAGQPEEKKKGPPQESPAVARRKLVDSTFAKIFGDIAIKHPSSGEKKGSAIRRQKVLELFLSGKWDDKNEL